MSEAGGALDSLIVGTAGHIDHGKTTLVRAMTGVETDRLGEEQRRGITIVLGFAPLTLPGGRRAGVVDVPGHERFVRTMVAGAGGVDIGLLVVSAEEGVMPQTREHLDILEMLGVPELVVALTRADTVDGELIELAELDARELLETSAWPEAPVLPVSGLTGQGVPELIAALGEAADRLPPRASSAVFRMPVDRSFSIKGFGTVVTGTTRDGRLSGSSTLEVLPGRQSVRIRGVQVHGEQAEEVGRGTRVALNLVGMDPDSVPPGSWLATPQSLACSDRIDVCFDLLPSCPWPLENNASVRFLCGTAELMATVRLIDPEGGPAPERLEPGAAGVAQLALSEEAGAVAGDRFVLRWESPMLTIGGGVILDPEPPLLRRRERKPAGALLRALSDSGLDSAQRVGALLRRCPGEALDIDALRRRLPPGGGSAEEAASSAVEEGAAVLLQSGRPAWVGTEVVHAWAPRIGAFVDSHHEGHPLLDGPLLVEARQTLLPRPEERVFEALLPALCEASGLEHRGPRLARQAHEPEPSEGARAALDRLVEALAAGGAHPPPLEEASRGLELPPDGVHWLVERGVLLRVAEDYYVERAAFRSLVRQLLEHMKGVDDGVLTPQAFKEISGLSRRHAIPFLEFLDRQRITLRTPKGRAAREVPEWVEPA